MARSKGEGPAERTIADECLAVRVRTLNRAVSALYDEALRPHGLRVGQLNLLVAVARLGSARPADLCGALRMEKSTLSRDAEVLRRRGWLEVEPAPGRGRPLKVTAEGKALLERAFPAWRRAQERAAGLIGEEGAEALRRMALAVGFGGAGGP